MVCEVDFELAVASLNPSETKYSLRKFKNCRKDGLALILKKIKLSLSISNLESLGEITRDPFPIFCGFFKF